MTAHQHGSGTGAWPVGEPPTTSSLFRRLASTVDDLGFDPIYHDDHRFPNVPNMEVLPLLGFWAASRITIGTGVLLVPSRDPVLAAKSPATIDPLPGGRLVLGEGVDGETEQERRAVQIDPAGRTSMGAA